MICEALRKSVIDERIAAPGLAELAPEAQVTVEVTNPDGDTWAFAVNHTFSADQIEWFKAGSALNIIRQNIA